MGLFTPKWMSDDRSKALKAVEKITDPQKLAVVAVNAKDQFVVGKAIERIHDEAVLAGIALGNAKFFPISRALERISDPDLLRQIADEADQNWVRAAALNRLAGQDHNIDLTPYRELIEVCVKAGNTDAVSLCTDRLLLEDMYRQNRHRWLMDKNQQGIMRSFEARIDQLAGEYIRGIQPQNVHELNRFTAPGSIYSAEVRSAARAKLNAMLLPENASQEELYEAALNRPAVSKEALSRLTDPELLAKIARSRKIPPGTRVQIAEKAGIGNPFGRQTLVCPNCGKPAVYRERYESIDSWKIEKDFLCRDPRQGCVGCGADDPLSCFAVGSARINWKDRLIFICPSCGKYRASSDSSDASAFLKRCDCGSMEAPIPVEYVFE